MDPATAARLSEPPTKPPTRRWAKDRPYLEEFALFPKLPLEIRIIIWKLTLQPRDIEIEYTQDRGFYTRSTTPSALRICHDSRNAVAGLYSLCFGNIIHEERILFNFRIDTLFLHRGIQPHLLHLFGSFKPLEVSQLRYLAVDSFFDEDYFEGDGEFAHYIDPIRTIKKAVTAMTALEDLRIVHDMEFFFEIDSGYSGTGPTELYEDFPKDLLRCHHNTDHCSYQEYELGDLAEEDTAEEDTEIGSDDPDPECTCITVPDVDSHWSILQGLKISAVFGRRME